MKHGLLGTVGLIGLGLVAFGASSVGATTAAGPYYATPSWDQQLPASTRFIVLSNWGNAAVLDRETGLVWEQSPSASAISWLDAQIRCNGLTTGGRLGWRLPTLQELASLVDPSVDPHGPTLPSGHPFTVVQLAIYWSATTWAGDTTNAWVVRFFTVAPSGQLLTAVTARLKNIDDESVWCVRGGEGVDPQ